MSKKNWVPEIVYEENPEGASASLPFIAVPPDEEMPYFLMLWESRETGEFEPGPEGEDLPIMQTELRQYARMDILKERLSEEDYDKVRVALGLEPLKTAAKKGIKISQNIQKNLS